MLSYKCIYQKRSFSFNLKSILSKQRPYPITKPSELETVIIGSGMGGLMSAAFLSKKGFPVTIVEQNAKLGGYIGAFERMDGKYKFEQVVHISPSSEQFRKHLEELGIPLSDLKLGRMGEIVRIKAPHYDVRIPLGVENVCEVISQVFPGEEGSVRKICQLAHTLCVEDLEMQKYATPDYFVPFKHPALFKYHKKTIKEAIDPITKNKDILDMLFGFYNLCFQDVPSDINALIPLTMLGSAMSNEMEVLTLTSEKLVDSFTKVITENGGRIILGNKVKEIVREGNRVQGVTLSSDVCLPAKAVISNLNPITTFQHLIQGKTKQDEHFLTMLNTKETTLSTFILYLGLRQDISDILPNYETFVLGNNDSHRSYSELSKGDITSSCYLATMYNHISPPVTPGTSVLSLMSIQSYDMWEEYGSDYFKGLKGTYNKRKQEEGDILLKRAEEDLIPGLRDMVEIMDIGTPLTNQRITGSHRGAPLGFRATPKQYILYPVKTRTHIKGLYLASSWVELGGGIVPSGMTGKIAYDAIRKDYNI